MEKRQKEREFVDEVLRSTIYSDVGKEELESNNGASSMQRSFDTHTFGVADDHIKQRFPAIKNKPLAVKMTDLHAL